MLSSLEGTDRRNGRIGRFPLQMCLREIPPSRFPSIFDPRLTQHCGHGCTSTAREVLLTLIDLVSLPWMHNRSVEIFTKGWNCLEETEESSQTPPADQKAANTMGCTTRLCTTIFIVVASIFLLVATATPWYKINIPVPLLSCKATFLLGFQTMKTLDNGNCFVSLAGERTWTDDCDGTIKPWPCAFKQTSLACMGLMVISCIIGAVVLIATILKVFIGKKANLLRIIMTLGSFIISVLVAIACIVYAVKFKDQVDSNHFFWYKGDYTTGGPVGWTLAVVASVMYLMAGFLAHYSRHGHKKGYFNLGSTLRQFNRFSIRSDIYQHIITSYRLSDAYYRDTNNHTNNMTVSVTLISTGETFQAEAKNLVQLREQIFQIKGIPQNVQMLNSSSGEVLEDGSHVQLSFNLHGGCSESCGGCGCGESCSCNIL
ncbi:hypothetical protein PROFUN_09379 [Planoprotostelium fungivorum]|uniref:Uncharacterized protein n=1 Tax=Planoprotostelium fungivorum TaxID=1890364 RepID=A0A2P6NGZ3_9EUKA|nr:hypothetical protein PROFUN_09379 [Planoprotostelium fungivorum]